MSGPILSNLNLVKTFIVKMHTNPNLKNPIIFLFNLDQMSNLKTAGFTCGFYI